MKKLFVVFVITVMGTGTAQGANAPDGAVRFVSAMALPLMRRSKIYRGRLRTRNTQGGAILW
jgi:hypothetical protein